MLAVLVYFTAANRDDVLQIGRVLVEERLAACVNVLGEIISVYRWEGAVQNESEVSALVKTRDGKLSAVIERIKQLHKYECPCVVSWPLCRHGGVFEVDRRRNPRLIRKFHIRVSLPRDRS